MSPDRGTSHGGIPDPAVTARLAREPFVLLTTFRGTGEPVPTPVWVVALEDRLVVLTSRDAGKLRRLEHHPAVTMQPCSPRGKVRANTSPVAATTILSTDPDIIARAWRSVRRKYRLPYRVLSLLGRLRSSWRRFGEQQTAILITIDPPGDR
jgi:PPOX class probable F420-dependent enzyme